MRGIAEQREPPEVPARKRVLIDHRILENRVGAADELRHVEPVEVPVEHGVDEILGRVARRFQSLCW